MKSQRRLETGLLTARHSRGTGYRLARGIRQHTSAYVRIRPHTSDTVEELDTDWREAYVSIRPHTSAYVRIRQHTPRIRYAYVSMRHHTSAYVSIRYAYVSIRYAYATHTCMKIGEVSSSSPLARAYATHTLRMLTYALRIPV
jgi:hypothetical protein